MVEVVQDLQAVMDEEGFTGNSRSSKVLSLGGMPGQVVSEISGVFVT